MLPGCLWDVALPWPLSLASTSSTRPAGLLRPCFPALYPSTTASHGAALWSHSCVCICRCLLCSCPAACKGPWLKHGGRQSRAESPELSRHPCSAPVSPGLKGPWRHGDSPRLCLSNSCISQAPGQGCCLWQPGLPWMHHEICLHQLPRASCARSCHLPDGK